ncbi:hypothetical protein [Notoacmeibacter ruber]|uniref:hypothetical protein n=1 Tax=Notoacmeibacter ruber TaxID=2670375 RepID=UPI000EF48788|nr:hypothetical protein [Notoacmeibacter ruber]
MLNATRSNPMLVRRFLAICLLSAAFGAGLSVVAAEKVRPVYTVDAGVFFPCIDQIQSNICLGPQD